MGTYTANKNLYMPTVGEQGWGDLMNTNLSTIDNFLKPITVSGSTYTFTGNHVGNQSGGTITATKITNSGTLTQTGTSTFTGKITGNGGIGTTSLTASSTSTFTGKITANGGIGTKALTATSISNSGNMTNTGTLTCTGKIYANGGIEGVTTINVSGSSTRVMIDDTCTVLAYNPNVIYTGAVSVSSSYPTYFRIYQYDGTSWTFTTLTEEDVKTDVTLVNNCRCVIVTPSNGAYSGGLYLPLFS